MASHGHAVEVPTTYYRTEQSVPRSRPLAEWRENYENEKKKLSEVWLQQVEWDTRIGGTEESALLRRVRKFHPFEAEKIKANSPWAHWDSILQITGLRPGIDLKQIITYLSRCPMMGYPTLSGIYLTCKRKLVAALSKMRHASWADDFEEVLKLPNQAQLETIRILGEVSQETPRLGYLPSGIYNNLKALGLAGMMADDQTNATALLCWRASLRAVGARMGYHSLEKLKEDCDTPLLTGYETVIDVDEYCQQQDQRRERRDALVADDRDQGRLEPKLEKSNSNKVVVQLEERNPGNVGVKLENSGTDKIQMWLEKSIATEPSGGTANDINKAITGLQHAEDPGDPRRRLSKGGYRDHHQSEIEPELDMPAVPSSDSSDIYDLAQKQDNALKNQESRIMYLESIVKSHDDILGDQESRIRPQESAIQKRRTRALRKDIKHKALTKRLLGRIRDLADENTALRQMLMSQLGGFGRAGRSRQKSSRMSRRALVR